MANHIHINGSGLCAAYNYIFTAPWIWPLYQGLAFNCVMHPFLPENNSDNTV